MPARKSAANNSRFGFKYFLDILLVLAILVIGFQVYSAWNKSLVVSVPDGDSLDLKDGRRVRLLRSGRSGDRPLRQYGG
jgi:hypothetical protein